MSDTATGILIVLIVLGLWVPPIVLGVRVARRKHRSAQWMGIGVHQMLG